MATRRDLVKAAYVAPVILTFPATPVLAGFGSNKQCTVTEVKPVVKHGKQTRRIEAFGDLRD